MAEAILFFQPSSETEGEEYNRPHPELVAILALNREKVPG